MTTPGSLLLERRHASTGEPASSLLLPAPVLRLLLVGDRLRAVALDADTVMAPRHQDLPWWGVQFHPESILTGEGKHLLANFLARCAPDRPS